MHKRQVKNKKNTAMSSKLKDKCANRRIALTNLPKASVELYKDLYREVLQLVNRYGDVACYDEEEDLHGEGDAGFYLPLDKEKEYALGCAFIEYESVAAAKKAYKSLQGCQFGPNLIKVFAGDSSQLLVQCLGCSVEDANQYLEIVDGDISKAAEVVISSHVSDASTGMSYEKTEVKDAPPARATILKEVAPKERTQFAPAPDKVPVVPKEAMQFAPVPEKLTVPKTAPVPIKEVQFAPVPDAVRRTSEDDRVFYYRYPHLVDGFINAVCGDATKLELRELVSAADAIVASDLGPTSEVVYSDLVNRPSFLHNVDEGRTPMSYTVAKNLERRVHDLIDIGADVSKIMASPTTMKTALVIAATNSKRDGTEMVRILLSKGAKPSELAMSGVDEKLLGTGMKYWLDKAKRVPIPDQGMLAHARFTPPMDRLHELDFAVVGQEAAISVVKDFFASRFGNRQGNGKLQAPPVMLLLGPPGHGKTYFSSNAARTLVGDDNFLFIPCQSIRDDADLFGSRLGGSRDGSHSSDGQLTQWLRRRQGKKCVVFLDEIEKMKGMTSSLGWKQDKKIFQSFLEPWNDGTLSDPGASSVGKIDCRQCVWVLTSNWGQSEIIDFCEEHKNRMYKKVDENDATWIQSNLVEKILRPLITKKLGEIDSELKALSRRIPAVVPFLPFTAPERKIVADVALTERFALYREPCILEGPEEKRRLFGNLHLRSTNAFGLYAAGLYDPMQGAGGALAAVQRADGKFQMMYFRDQLGLSPEQKARIMNPKRANATDEPEFWIHYDKDTADICIMQSQPPDDEDEDCSECSDDTNDYSQGELDPKEANKRSTFSGTADDAF